MTARVPRAATWDFIIIIFFFFFGLLIWDWSLKIRSTCGFFCECMDRRLDLNRLVEMREMHF